MQHIRTKLLWVLIDAENEAIKKGKERRANYKAEILTKGDTLRELLERSKYLLYKYEDDWTFNQKKGRNYYSLSIHN